jgi:hypothetical protein
MGPELFGLILIAALAVGAILFFSGAFGAGAAGGRSKGNPKPKHALVENDTSERIVGGVETRDRVRAEAESDPDTEVRE